MDISPRPVTKTRVRNAIRALGLIGFVDDEGDVGVHLAPYTFFFVLPTDAPPLCTSSWNRHLNIQFAEQAANFVTRYNSQHYSPKIYSLVTDEGQIRFRLSYVFSWLKGATDEQIRQEVDAVLRTGLAAMRSLETEFPDQWVRPGKSLEGDS